MQRKQKKVQKKGLFVLIFIPVMMMLSGCGGGVAGEGGNQYPQTSGTTIVRANSFNDEGWDLISKGQYQSAIALFNQVLADNPTAQEACEANSGLGWARGRIGSLKDGMEWFAKAVDGSNDAKVGMAAAYIQMGSKSDLENAVDLLYTKLGGENPHFHYTTSRATGVSDAECHALLAFAFAGIGRSDDATIQLDYAKELNPNWQSTTIEQINNVVDFLNK
ncbi:MAG: tetratricopeptide repeat protein [Candidatus Riflebacteria bacterium]|nr:tetratricopeptide repeat protein [Candidatus Riflebacteria bacterium]